MADSILQMYGNTIGAGTTNAVASVDVPQSGRLRKVILAPQWRGLIADQCAIFEVSTLPTARWGNNGDFGNVLARAYWNIELITSGFVAFPAQEITGLDFRLTIGQRIFLHVFATGVPGSQDDCYADLYMDV